MLKRGDWVEMTNKAMKAFLCSGNRKYPPTTTGLVLWDQEREHVLILRDGRKHPSSYHISFWQLQSKSHFQLNR